MRRTARNRIRHTDAVTSMRERWRDTYGDENASVIFDIALDISYRIGDRILVASVMYAAEHAWKEATAYGKEITL